jgi:ABC-type nitrate/sulfonate/bicarbonate transport system ATPase subunit
MTLVQVSNVCVRYGNSNAIEDISLCLSEGEFVSIVGPSGCGKSTLLKVLMGVVASDVGQVEYNGLQQFRDQHPFAFMPQRDALMPWLRVIDNVSLGLAIQGVGKAAARRRVEPLFERFGLTGFERHYPAQLSGGMRQRAALMRTVVQNKPVQLLDEPFSALDALTRVELQRWLETQWRHEKWSTILVTHDVREAITLSDRIYVLSTRPGRILGEVAVPHPRPRKGSEFLKSASRIEAQILDLLLTQTGIPI